MNYRSTKNIPLGIYKVYWKSGGYSIASIGQYNDGERWIAPINWVFPTLIKGVHKGIESLEMIKICDSE